MTPDKQLRPVRWLRDRYGRSTKAIDRWVKDGVLPPPAARVRDQRLWDVAEVEERERTNMGLRSNTTDTETEPQALPSSR